MDFSSLVFEWDPRKAAANLAKHGMPFESIAAFDWDNAIIHEDMRFSYSEQRFNAFSFLGDRLHAVVFTFRGKAIRVIGFRKANERERRRYEKEKT